MNIRNRFDRMFGKSTSTPSIPEQLPSPTNMPVLLPMSPTSPYQQWYERDEELFNSEKASLEANGFPAECATLPDGKMCFTTTICGKQVALICTCLHPLEPVMAQMLDEVDASSVVDEVGKIDLFAHDGFRWNTEVRLGVVAQRVATLLSVSCVKPPATQAPDAKHVDISNQSIGKASAGRSTRSAI